MDVSSCKMASGKSSKKKVFTAAEEDEISKISIQSSDEELSYRSDDEFTVERVLAEKLQDGKRLYLLSWTGYPEEENSVNALDIKIYL